MNKDEIFKRAGLPLPQKGVSYNNKDYKENKDYKDYRFAPLSLDSASRSAVASREIVKPQPSSTEEGQLGWEPLDSRGGEVKAETPGLGIKNPAITPAEVDRCILTFYDNGEGTRQRYKLAITINPNSAPNEKWEFIANLNKDRRIFRRNVPEENQEFVLEFGDLMRDQCKKKYNVYPFLGKIHNNSKSDSNQPNQKEDGCAAAVYWNGSEWMATVMLWEYFIKDIPLTDSFFNEKQKKSNAKSSSGVLYGPESVTKANWQKSARPTFKSRKTK